LSIDHTKSVQAAREHAQRASEVAAKLKPGTYDSVTALAVTSIAHSLSVLAAAAAEGSR